MLIVGEWYLLVCLMIYSEVYDVVVLLVGVIMNVMLSEGRIIGQVSFSPKLVPSNIPNRRK